MIRRVFYGVCSTCLTEQELKPSSSDGFICKKCNAKHQSATRVKAEYARMYEHAR